MKTVIDALKRFGMRITGIKEMLRIPRSSCYEILKDKEQKDYSLIERIQKIAYEFLFYGYRRIYTTLRREGFIVNHKKVYRLYRSLNLERKSKKRKRFIPFSSSVTIRSPSHKNEIWALDFIHDSLTHGKGMRILVIMDIFTRRVVGYRIGVSIGGDEVVELLRNAIEEIGKPEIIRIDIGVRIHIKNS